MYVAVHVNHSRGMHFVEENNLSLNSVPTKEIGKPCRAHNKSIITAIQFDCFDLQSLTNISYGYFVSKRCCYVCPVQLNQEDVQKYPKRPHT